MPLVAPTSGVTVVDSASAVAALFAEDASAECALPSIVSGVDFTTDSIAVFPGSAAGASGLGIYQAGAQIVFVTTAAGGKRCGRSGVPRRPPRGASHVHGRRPLHDELLRTGMPGLSVAALSIRDR